MWANLDAEWYRRAPVTKIDHSCEHDNHGGLQVTDHARQLLEKHFKKPFLNLSYAGGSERMDEDTVREGIAWLDDCFHIIRHQDDVMPSVEWILDLARAAVLRYFSRRATFHPV